MAQPYAAAVVWLIACTAGVAVSAEFDEKLQAPRVRNAVELRSQAQSFAARAQQMQATAPERLVNDPTLWAERFDLSWQIQQAIDAQEPLGDLSAIGLESTGDGAYRIDFAKAPQWRRLDEMMVAILPRTNWTNLEPQLIARGFREGDVNALQDYVESHNVEAAAAQGALPISTSFSRAVKTLDKLKRPVSDDLVLSYLYQRKKADAEARREWAAGVLRSLDAQRARILISYFGEMGGSSIWAPSDRRAGIADVLATLRRPDFEMAATAEAKGAKP